MSNRKLITKLGPESSQQYDDLIKSGKSDIEAILAVIETEYLRVSKKLKKLMILMKLDDSSVDKDSDATMAYFKDIEKVLVDYKNQIEQLKKKLEDGKEES